MALIRPVVLVYQDFANPTVTPVNPDLNCLIVGPAYHILDYYQPGTTTYQDKSDIRLATDYGTFEAAPGAALPAAFTASVANNAVGALVDADSVVVYFDAATARITYGTSGTTDALTPNQFDVSDLGVDFTAGDTEVLPGDRVLVKDALNVTIVRTVLSVDSATQLHFTQDIPAGFAPGASQAWRIERTLNDQLVASSGFSVSGNNVTINAGITLTANSVAKPVTYAKVYAQYRSLRQDLQQVDTVSSTDEITTKIGRLDARNPLAVGCFVALQNTTGFIQFYGVQSNDLIGHTDCIDAIASRPDVYAVVPLTADISVLAAWNSDSLGLATPDETRGRPQRFRVVIGSGELPLIAEIIEPKASGQIVQVSGTASGGISQLTIPGATLIADGVIPGDVLTVALDVAPDNLSGVYTVAQVISNTVLEVDGVFAAAKTLDVLATYEIKSSDGLTTRRAAAVASAAGTSAASVDLYLLLKDATGTFVTSSVMPGDIIEIPADTASNDFTGAIQFVVESVLSDNRLQIVNNGRNTSTVENELPHGVKRTAPTALVPTTAVINYRVVRNQTKSQQVTSLVAIAQSFQSSRCILVWPDLVNVAGIVGGDSQPGYYASCAVGGMTAGLPPHQGFTYLGIAGISRIFHSNTYFSDSQLTDLSNGGWYVFAQQTPSTLPYTIHQLTTDVSTLETGEYSVRKNFDYVSLFFVDILEEFLGVYNVTPETLTLLRAALTTGGDSLRLRVYPKIGAPLTSFSITSLGVSPISADRVLAYVAIGLPKPLNVIELHLVA
jgi:hypothetical protein